MKKLFYLNMFSALFVALVSCSDDEWLSGGNTSSDNLLKLQVEYDDTPDAAFPEAFIFRGETLASRHALSRGVNALAADVNPGDVIKVTARGYEPYVLRIDDRGAAALRSSVMNVKLKPVLMMVVQTFADDDTYVIDLEGSGKISIVWPDNTTETGTLPLSFSREFDTGAGGQILLKGDIGNVTLFRAFGYNTVINEISGLKHMHSLESFLPGWILLSERLDLHHNTMLETLDLFNATLPDWMHLPVHHSINSITTTLADRSITSQEVDMLISNIYRNTTRRNIRGGTIALTGSEDPSPQTLRKIEVLENDFGWRIELNL